MIFEKSWFYSHGQKGWYIGVILLLSLFPQFLAMTVQLLEQDEDKGKVERYETVTSGYTAFFCPSTRTFKIRLTKYVAENLEQDLLTQQESKCDNLVEIPFIIPHVWCYVSLELEDWIFASQKMQHLQWGCINHNVEHWLYSN